MVYLFGHDVEVTSERQCRRSATDHMTLVHEARVDRQKKQFNVEESYVLCMMCGKAISLNVEKSFAAGVAG